MSFKVNYVKKATPACPTSKPTRALTTTNIEKFVNRPLSYFTLRQLTLISQRLKDMKQLTRDTGSSTSRSKGSDSGELQSISVSTQPAKKKPLFKAVGFAPVGQQAVVPASAPAEQGEAVSASDTGDESGAVRNGWAEERYDPRFVSGCASDCGVCGGESGRIEV